MATMFQSLRSSSMPKRLLRYALSRLELLDADALDMDNLDLAIGRNTVFEFRDVGIRLKKLEKILQLPSSFELLKAKVLLLRITIPVDFYTSPITVEVDGVDVRIRVASRDTISHAKPSRLSRTSTSDVVPNTADLAQSFLENQPEAEKKRLEEAIAAETQDLGASVTISDDGSEEEAAFGTGQPLSLPAFLADFLQGIVDRTQIRIRGVTFQLDIEVPLEATTSPGSDTVTFQIALEGINVEGVTAPDLDENGVPLIVHREGKRHVSLSNIRAYLVSEANVFSAFARSPSVASPAIPRSPVTSNHSSFRQGSLSRESSSLSANDQYVDDYLASSMTFGQDEPPLRDSEVALNIPYDFSNSDEESDGPEEEAVEEEEDSPPTPRASVHPDFLPQQPTITVSQSTNIAEVAQPWASVHRGVDSTPALGNIGLPDSTFSERPRTPEISTPSPGSDAHLDPEGEEDLSKSHIFSHEEAESMYASAFSELPSQPSRSMPGSWDTYSSPSNSPPQDTKNVVQPSDQPGDEVEDKFEDPESPSVRPSHPSEAVTEVEPEETGDNGTLSESVYDPPKDLLVDATEDKSDDEGDIRGQDEDLESSRIRQSLYSSHHTDNSPLEEVPQPEEDASVDRPPTPPQDQTPRGPTRLVKELITLDTISIYAPLHHKHIHVHPTPDPSDSEPSPSLKKSTSPHLPGAFSVYSQTHDSFISSRGPPPQPQPQAQPHQSTLEPDDSLEIVLSPIDIRFDASIGFLLATVISKLLEVFNTPTQEPATPTPAAAQPNTEGAPAMPALKVMFEKISVHFLHHLMGVADTSERHLNPAAFEFDQVTLLRCDLEELSVSVKNAATVSTTLINLGKFRFGYADSDILSFDRALKLGASVRDVFPPSGADVSVKLTRAGKVTKTEVTTLALVVNLDLQRLDETFSWFGGLSSFLNMGSSMSSVAPASVQTVAPVTPSARGVRFETPINPNDRSAASDNKMDMRIAGFYLRIVGKECEMSLETSAVKMVKRNEGLGVAVSAISLSGPYLSNLDASPPIRVEVEGTRLEYLAYPQDSDLERLLKLITPSKVQPDLGDNEIMVDTLLRQRRKGPVLRMTLDSVRTRVHNVPLLACLPGLGEEIARLSTVAKYLPEDDRPGLLTLGRIKNLAFSADLEGNIGMVKASLREFELAHITLPSLVALGLESLVVTRNETEELVTSPKSSATADELVLIARMIGDEIEPIFKLRLQGLAFEYRVPTLMDLLGLGKDATPQDFEAELAASVANLGEHAHAALLRQQTQSPALSKSQAKQPAAKPLAVRIVFRDCLLGLNPLGLQSKLTLALTDSRLQMVLPKDENVSAEFELRKAAILLIDDITALHDARPPSRPRVTNVPSQQVSELCAQGFVEICFISSAKASVAITTLEDGEKQVDVSFRDDLLVLETCADSTQTLIALANGLKPPTPPSKEIKYRTNVMPVEDLLSSISAEAFGNPEGEYDFDNDFAIAQELAGDAGDDEASDVSQLEFHDDYYGEVDVGEKLLDATASSLGSLPASQGTNVSDLHNFNSKASTDSDLEDTHLVVHDDWFASDASEKGTAKVWNSARNTYDRAPPELVKRSPLKVSVLDVHIIWNLFDGYDWVHTRDVIAKAVHEVEAKANERRARNDGLNVYDEDLEDEEAVIGDFLFNSIYIGIPANRDARDLARAINHDLNDNATETESIATTAFTTSTARAGGAQRSGPRLKLNRSKRHKITFELQGVDVDLIAFPPGSGETESSIDVRVKNLDIFDHVPTSTWKKFATYDQDAGEREMGSSMVHIEMLNVRPLPDLAASEIVMRVTVLPLRLHVDQDALDFITRFFEFKDDDAVVSQSPTDMPFLQRAEVNDIPVKLDFKPKRVDYAGLRSGRTTEFMNFVILDEARMVLRHTIIYGVSGFERLGRTLNDIWMPDVKKNQLPGVLAGLAPVRSLVNVGSGFRNLVEIPLKEYKKDGRIVRSISKGATAFVRTTGTEIIKLGAKVAVGTQYALQGAEGLLVQRPEPEPWELDETDSEEPRQISLYADQPINVIQGLRGGYASLSRDLNLARDAIIAVPAAVMESQNAQGAAKAVLKKAPTIIFRPAIGATKALGQTLLGATNSLDPHNKRRVEEKYKKR
ncbi:Autophagy-related protein 2 [Scedosporium apiospermum]|uniref:Autophagy-related protein 2 n=1 Tax=Pseudallescheria apiosperma TaxID=563466 RepID=A0A084G021_PSEDA|nr:Autophagy-related protein 2 [Scedosporium apiospermum]KEZ40683.1 Autophagy-related protein 2 [Scedosporium apiospermum]